MCWAFWPLSEMAATCPERPRAPDDENGQLYTWSRMVNTINKSMGDVGEVQVKKQGTDGAYYPVTETDVAAVDLQMKVAQIARGIKDWSPERKLQFSREASGRVRYRSSRPRLSERARAAPSLPLTQMRDAGNEQFRAEHYAEAMDVYVQAMVGLDEHFFAEPGADGAPATTVMAPGPRDAFALPILTNLAACALELRDWKRCLLFCDHALQLEPGSYRALCRRGRALTELERFGDARAALHAAAESARGDDEARHVRVLLRGLQSDELKRRAATNEQREMMRRAFDARTGEAKSMYGDMRRRKVREGARCVFLLCFDGACRAQVSSLRVEAEPVAVVATSKPGSNKITGLASRRPAAAAPPAPRSQVAERRAAANGSTPATRNATHCLLMMPVVVVACVYCYAVANRGASARFAGELFS